MMIYLIGSLRNDRIIPLGNAIRELGIDVHDDWHSAGPEADDYWLTDQKLKGLTYKEALAGPAAQFVFNFDKEFLDRADAGVLVLPAGKSAHLEAGYLIGWRKPVFVLFDKEPDRWDVMYNFAKDVFFSVDDLIVELKRRYENVR